MECIFSDNLDYSEETQNKLKQVMLASEQEQTDISI
jgi:bla regulator protein BlaR1